MNCSAGVPACILIAHSLETAILTLPNKGPLIGSRAQMCLHGILDCVFANPRKVGIVANQVVIGFLLPEWLALGNLKSGGLPRFMHMVRSERFPAMQNCRQGMPFPRRHDYMDMIRHDNPRMQIIPITVEIGYGISDKMSYLRKP